MAFSKPAGLYCEMYYEEQHEALCGLHTVNGLLQGAWHDPKSFAKIAKKLDKQEKGLGLGRAEGKNAPHGQDANVQAPSRGGEGAGSALGPQSRLACCPAPAGAR